jgi:hypothetical protein
MSSDVLAALEPVVDVLERLGVEYSVVGSVASSFHGVARSTIDIDVVAELPGARVDELVTALAPDYYVDLDAARDAVKRRSMFNLVHLATMLKVDLYVLTDRAFDRESFARRARGQLDATSGRGFFLDTPEDTILHKLEWYRFGGEVSERQWGDLVGVLRVQGDALDMPYLRRWAAALDLDPLLDRALAEAQ